MADQATGEKSEKATSGKLKKARDKGDVPRSKEGTLAVNLLTTFFSLSFFFPYYYSLMKQSFIHFSAFKLHELETIPVFLTAQLIILAKFIVTLLAIPGMSLIAGLIPGGWLFVPNRIIPDFKKINPITGFGRLFSSNHIIDVAKMLLKCSIMLYLLYSLIHANISEFMRLQYYFLSDAIRIGFSYYRHIILLFIIVIAIFAIIDLPLSVFLFNKKMRMTKQEVKEEYKNNEGKPELKSRLRQLQRQLAFGQINKSVPTANVIITNPTHYAVALKYDPKKADAPFVVAKGVDEIALYIRQVANKHKIDVLELPPLARAIYHTTKVNQQIPTQLYKAIAYVLSYILQLKNWRAGKADKPLLKKSISIPKEVLDQYDNQ